MDPLNEENVRIWLREIYPQIFNKQDFYDKDYENCSLQLEEIRAVFRAIIEEHIKEEWFSDKIFSPELGESLALVLRNQRDRLLLDYYQRLDINFPSDKNENQSIWRQVLHHVAFNNQLIESQLWILNISEQIKIDCNRTDEPTYVDKFIGHIINCYDDEPFMPVIKRSA